VSAATAKWIEAFAENTTDKVVALYAKDAVLWGTSSPTVRSDPGAIRAYFDGAFKALPGLRLAFVTNWSVSMAIPPSIPAITP
jgi:hypothetical protein